VPILAKGKTVKGRIWTYVREDRPFAGRALSAAVYYASRDRRHEHPARHLHAFTGILQADAYRGCTTPRAFQGRSPPLCVGRTRGGSSSSLPTSRQVLGVGKNAAAISPIALEAVKRIDAIFDIERGINGQSAEERLRVRRAQSAPLVAALEAWLREQRSRLSRSCSVTEPIDYMLRRWERFARFVRADHKALAVVVDLGFGPRVEIGDDLGPGAGAKRTHFFAPATCSTRTSSRGDAA
jgi:hypothetical protein